MGLREINVWRMILFASLLLPLALQAQNQQQGQPAKQPIQPTPLPADIDPNDPALPVWMKPEASRPASGPARQPTDSGSVGEVTKSGGGFVYKTQVDEVTLHATVLDEKKHILTDLTKSSFVVYEDGQTQQITSLRREDIPVSLGLVIDNSGSMRDKRLAVTKAVLNLVRASHPQDEVFVVNFNDDAWIDQDFTSNIGLMQEALDRVDSRGGTALYDSIIASADHLTKLAKREKKVLLVVTDGEDNASRRSLEEAIRSVQIENGPAIYTIGILGHEGHQRRAQRALESLANQTGGVAFFPKNLNEVDDISLAVAHDIRSQYALTYKSSNPQRNGGYRAIKVVAHAPGRKELQVRTRSGYFAGKQQAGQ